MCPGGYMTGHLPSKEDEKIKSHYVELASTDWSKRGWNAADCYVADQEPFGKTRLYPSKKGENVHCLADKFRQDYELRLKWGTLHSVCLFKAFNDNLDKIPWELADQVAEKIHPYYYYVKRTETACSKEGCSSWDVYLLVEAHTIYGWYQYHYEQVTHSEGDTTLTVWELKDTVQLYPDRYQFLKENLKDFYKSEKDIDTTARWVLEAGEGFYRQKEWVKFLAQNYDVVEYTSEAMVPPQYWAFLEEAEQKFKVPPWFMAALIFKESSWDPFAVNDNTGCFGLTQQHPDFYKQRWSKLGFDPEEDKWNPRAQVLAGAMTLTGFTGNVDWEKWQDDENLKKGLARYGGYKDVETAGEYIGGIFELAENLKHNKWVWPVDSYNITCGFGVTGPSHPTPHMGIDIGVPENTPVKSVSAGMVWSAGYSDIYGNYIRIRDACHEYLYAHLNQVNVARNQVVSPGQIIGLSGNTGRSTGPHLHFGVKNIKENHYIDPLLFLR